jgi:hypothetical protein
MFKVFRRLDFETFKKLYKVYIRPLLEYANVIWSPHLQRDIDTLERIQRRATKRVAGLRSSILLLPSWTLIYCRYWCFCYGYILVSTADGTVTTHQLFELWLQHSTFFN